MERGADGKLAADAAAGRRWLADRLTPADFDGLSRQGFVAIHQLPSGAHCAKLRYRDVGQRQRVLYIGTNDEIAANVAAALAELQASLDRRRQVRRLARRGAEAQRDSIRQLDAPLQQIGWHFHGRQPRRRRPTKASGRHPAPVQPTSQNPEPSPMPRKPRQSSDSAANQPAEPVAPDPHDDLRRWALSLPEPIDVSLGFHAATLLEISSLMAEPIKTEILEAADRLETIADLTPQTEVMLKTSRQGERLLKMIPRLTTTKDDATLKKGGS